MVTHHCAPHHLHHELYVIFVFKSLLPHQRMPRLEVQAHPQGAIKQLVALPVSLFPSGSEDVTHPLLVLYVRFQYPAHVGVSLCVSGDVGQELLVAPVIGVDVGECPPQLLLWIRD